MVDDQGLYGLLGLDAETSPDRLRYAYEQQVADAARRGDTRRALALSAAFDALDPAIRSKVYAGRGYGQQAAAIDPRPRQLSLGGPREHRSRRQLDPYGQPSRIGRPARIAIVLICVAAFGLYAVHAVQQLSRNNGRLPAATFPQQPAGYQDGRLGPADIAQDLDRANGREDVTCDPVGSATSTELNCQSTDGQTWAVTITAPHRYVAKVVTPSIYRQSADSDLRKVVASVQQCSQRTGTLPPSAPQQSVHASLNCNGGTMTIYLAPGNLVRYQRSTSRQFTVEVTASNGESARYDSATGEFSP